MMIVIFKVKPGATGRQSVKVTKEKQPKIARR